MSKTKTGNVNWGDAFMIAGAVVVTQAALALTFAAIGAATGSMKSKPAANQAQAAA
jgi:outer membrane protein assembly factor BamE (lipoprotein component of BamABCDE complex)